MGLTVLYSPQDANDAASSPMTAAAPRAKNIAVDIVLVHGLSGDATQSWTNEKTKAFWPKDFLPKDIPDARVLTYGYNVVSAFGNTTATVIDHAKGLLSSLIDKRDDEKRPIVFIAHSLGGIVVKQALFSARIEPQYMPIFQYTAGIIFFGTPHRGIDKAAYGKILSGVASNVINKPSSALLNALKTNSPVLAQLTTDFRHQLSQYQIVSFYETKPMGMFKDLIVVKHSALLDVAGEDQVPLDANHRNMCQFPARDDEDYEKLFNRIRRVLKVKSSVTQKDITSINEYYLVPHHVSANFTGRDEVREKLLENCLGSQTPNVQRRFVLHGLGGSGKTQVSLKFVQDHREKFWGVFWIDCTSVQTMEQSYTEIGKFCNVQGGIQSVLSWLSNTQKLWLLIFDNADDISLGLLPFIPTGSRGIIIITTRNPELECHQTVGSYEFGEMEEEEALELLLKTSGKDPTSQEYRQPATEIVATLGNLALAIVQAGAFIAQGMCHIDDYCATYHRHHKTLLARRPIQAHSDYNYIVYITWEISVQMIEQMGTHTSKHAMDLLRLFSGFHFDGINEEIFERAWKQTKSYPGSYLNSERQGLHRLNWLCAGTSTIWDPFHFHESVSLLLSFSLIKLDTFATIRNYSLHPLVHSWARDRIGSDEQKVWSTTSAQALATSIPWEESSSDYQFRRSILTHIIAALKTLTKDVIFESGDGRQERLGIVSIFMKVLRETGQINDAIRLGEKLVQARIDLLGKEHNETLDSMNELAMCYGAIGRPIDAMNLDKQALEGHKNTLGKEHPNTLTSMSNLATSYRKLGRYQDAAELNEEVLEVRRRVLGDEHSDTLHSLSNLALIYGDLGRYLEVIEINEKVLEVRRRVLGEEHPSTLISIGNLAFSYSHIGRYEEAIKLNENVLRMRRRVLGEEHPDTLQSMHNLAIYYGQTRRLNEAIALLETACELRQRVLGEGHPLTLGSFEDLETYRVLKSVKEHPVELQTEGASDAGSLNQDEVSKQQSPQASDSMVPPQAGTSAQNHEPVPAVQEKRRKSPGLKALVQRIRR